MALLRRLSFIMFFIGLAGCGGGDGSLSTGGTGTGGTNSDAIIISLSVSSDGEAVSKDNPLVVSAKVTKGSEPLVNELVSFSIDDEEVAYFSGNGSVATGTDGIAEITVNAGSKSGGVRITASVDGADEVAISFNSAGDGNVVSGPQVSTISLLANNQQLASSGAQEIALTAIAKNSSNNLLSGVDISFTSDSGALLISTTESGVPSSTTNANGQASAILRTQGNPENRTIVVKASYGSITDEINIYVVGTTIQVSGSSALALDDPSTLILNVLNSDSEGIADVDVALSLANDPASGAANISVPTQVKTNAEGQAIVNVTGVTGGTNSIVATALGTTATKAISVQADSFVFTSFNNGNGQTVNPSTSIEVPDVLLSDTATITLTWNRSGQPIADGTKVDFTTTRGSLSASTGVINNGKVSVNLTSVDAGNAIVTFTGVDDSIEITNQLEFEFVAETVDRLLVQASPKSIGPDGQTSTISVVARDPNGNLVKNKTIVFSLSDTTGGSIFPAEAITDSKGSASTVYTSKTVSAQDDIEVTATVKDQPSVMETVTLTVADRELFIAVGTGNEIQDDETTYTKRFAAFVTDADSNPVVGQKLTVSAVPDAYYKGRWVAYYENGEFKRWITSGEVNSDGHAATGHDSSNASYDYRPATRCNNEDTNINGILDPGEDTNKDGSLTPGNVIASILTVSVDGDNTLEVEAITDNEGKVNIDLVYPQSYGSWVDINLIVSGKVSGTESFVKTTYTLPNSAEDVSEEDVSPPTASIGMSGPFGEHNSCDGAQ